MKKLLLLLISILIIISCKNKTDIKSEKIIYKLHNKGLIDTVYSVLKKKYQMHNVVVNMDSFRKNMENVLYFNTHKEKFVQEIIKRNKRFLKIKDTLIPVLFNFDYMYYEHSDLLKSCGGGTSFYLNKNEELKYIYY